MGAKREENNNDHPTEHVPGQMWGPEGPAGGYFSVSGGTAQDFEDTHACLGATLAGFTYYLEIPSNLPISDKGAFTYRGPASVWNGMGKTGRRVWTALEGRFTSSTQASVTLEVIYEQCGAFNLTIKDLSSWAGLDRFSSTVCLASVDGGSHNRPDQGERSWLKSYMARSLTFRRSRRNTDFRSTIGWGSLRSWGNSSTWKW